MALFPRSRPVRPTCSTPGTMGWMPCVQLTLPPALLQLTPASAAAALGREPAWQHPPGSYLTLVLRRALALAVGELLDAVVDSNAALARCQVLLGDLHPAQRAHSKALSRDTRHLSATGTATSVPHPSLCQSGHPCSGSHPHPCQLPPSSCCASTPTLRQWSWRVRYLGAGLCAVLEVISMPGQ